MVRVSLPDLNCADKNSSVLPSVHGTLTAGQVASDPFPCHLQGGINAQPRGERNKRLKLLRRKIGAVDEG